MSYIIHVLPSGHELTASSQESILEAALKQGLAFPYGCRTGHCGVCRARLLNGDIHYLTAQPPALQKIDTSQEILLCQAAASTDISIEVREIDRLEDIVVKKMPCRVVKMQRLSHDVMQLFLKLPDNERLQFVAGQYIDFLLQDGRRRSFSLANPPYDDALLEVHVRYIEEGSFTHDVFYNMREKAILRFEGPLGNFCLNQASRLPIIFLAGGTGFAPIKSMIQHALARGIKREMFLYWGVRDQADLYMDELAKSWAKQYPYVHYIPVLSDAKSPENWSGRTGLVHDAVLQDFSDLSEYEVYAAGPPVMVGSARNNFTAQGLPSVQFYSDPFEFSFDAPR